MILEIIIGAGVLIGGLSSIAYSVFKKQKPPKLYTDLKHIKVPPEWKQITYDSWVKASTILQLHGIAAKTQCSKIIIEKGEKLNPKTGQWGKKARDGFWYAGIGATTWIKIVATPEGKPYAASKAILAHEVAETILSLHPKWSKSTNDERNIFLWSLGL